MVEFINLSLKVDKIVLYFGGLFFDEFLFVNGFIDFLDCFGFGVMLCKDNLCWLFKCSDEDF